MVPKNPAGPRILITNLVCYDISVCVCMWAAAYVRSLCLRHALYGAREEEITNNICI